MNDCLQQDQLAALLTAFTAANSTAKVALFINNRTPLPTDTYASFTEASQSWYSRQNAVYGQVFQEGSGNMRTVVDSVQFNYSSGDGLDAPVTVYGYMIVTASGSTLLHSARLDTARTMGNTLDSVVVEPALQLPSIPQS